MQCYIALNLLNSTECDVNLEKWKVYVWRSTLTEEQLVVITGVNLLTQDILMQAINLMKPNVVRIDRNEKDIN